LTETETTTETETEAAAAAEAELEVEREAERGLVKEAQRERATGTMQRLRVAKTHRIPYLYRSFPEKK